MGRADARVLTGVAAAQGDIQWPDQRHAHHHGVYAAAAHQVLVPCNLALGAEALLAGGAVHGVIGSGFLELHQHAARRIGAVEPLGLGDSAFEFNLQ